MLFKERHDCSLNLLCFGSGVLGIAAPSHLDESSGNALYCRGATPFQYEVKIVAIAVHIQP